MSAATKTQCLGVILAGGESRRMGRPDKFLLEWRGKSLLNHVIDRADHQVDRLIISANGDPARLTHFHLPIVSDRFEPQSGPLAGILSAMQWAREKSVSYQWLASFASDTPFFPQSCVSDMQSLGVKHGLNVVYACCGNRAHYTFSLWSMDIYPELLAHFEAGERSLRRAAHLFRHQGCPFGGDNESFFNINTPTQWRQLMRAPQRLSD